MQGLWLLPMARMQFASVCENWHLIRTRIVALPFFVA